MNLGPRWRLDKRVGDVKIYTRTGDRGETGLLDGERVSKANARVDAFGEIDELNAAIGLALTAGAAADVGEMLTAIQRDLFALGGRLADPRRKVADRGEKAALGQAAVERLEGWIDALEGELPPLRRFILPGGSPAGAALHVARTVCRRAERRIAVLGPDAIEPALLAYVNRLSDLLFVMARVVNRRAGASETEW